MGDLSIRWGKEAGAAPFVDKISANGQPCLTRVSHRGKVQFRLPGSFSAVSYAWRFGIDTEAATVSRAGMLGEEAEIFEFLDQRERRAYGLDGLPALLDMRFFNRAELAFRCHAQIVDARRIDAHDAAAGRVHGREIGAHNQ